MKKIINFVFLFLHIKNSMQFNYFPILEALDFKNPYIISNGTSFDSKSLIKSHFQRSEMAMICLEAKKIAIDIQMLWVAGKLLNFHTVFL